MINPINRYASMKTFWLFQITFLRLWIAVLLGIAAAGAGCGILFPAPPEVPNTLNTEWRCDALVADFDKLIRAAGVMDVQAARIENYPCLRVNRFLGSFRNELTGREQKAEWITRAGRLGSAGRNVELANLPSGWFRKYFPAQERSTIAEVLDNCGRLLTEQVSTQPEEKAAVIEKARVPDDYNTWARIAGLYPVTRLVVFPGIWGLHREAKQDFQDPQFVNQTDGNWYYPDKRKAAFPADHRLTVLEQARRQSALGIPEPAPDELARFFDYFAPVFHVLPHPGSDRIGWPHWAGERVAVDVRDPAVFRYHSFTRMDGEIFLQLNYVIWFPDRPSQGLFDFYSGHLDGLTWRVTLDEKGKVMIYDSIHPCGCYHKYFPVSDRLAVREDPETGEPPLILEDRIPDGEDSRVAIHLTGIEHFVVGLTSARNYMPEMITYRNAPYDRLRSLPRGDGFASMFGEDAIVAGSQRPERWFFWPMGVPSAGAMRQRGHHAISFVGRLHFDDPRFFEKAFELKSP